MDVVQPEIATMDVDVDGSPQTQNLTRTGRPRRNYRLPRRFDDFLPEPASPTEMEPETGSIRRVILIVRDSLVAAANSFGVWRDYPRRPTRDPDASLTLDDLAVNPSKSDPTTRSAFDAPELPASQNLPYWPFANATIHRVMQWLNNGHVVKSEGQMNEFVHKVILAPDFAQNHLSGFDAHSENVRLDTALAKSTLHEQFTESAVDILVPSGAVGILPQTFSVPGLLHRKLTKVISDAFSGHLSHLLHFSPFKLYYKSPITKKEERIFGEIYTSDAFIQEHEKVQRYSAPPPNDPECKREKVVAAVMFSSDATHLTTFGTAKAWPIYLMLGNLSKYIRAQPNSGAIYHLAYIPSVSTPTYISCLQFRYSCIFRSYLIRFRILHQLFIASGGLKINLFSLIADESSFKAHGIYYLTTTSSTHVPMELLLRVSTELSDAFIPGFLLIQRIIQKSSYYDLPVFVLISNLLIRVSLATIRDNGLFPCHRCLVHKSGLHRLGLPDDIARRIEKTRTYLADLVKKARKLIYKDGKGVNSSGVDDILKEYSGVPTVVCYLPLYMPTLTIS